MEAYIGQIILFAGNFAPKNWAFCDGRLLPISQNTALFSLLGTTYGGDGRSTFALPDLRGRAPIHASGSHPLGAVSGTETVSLTGTQIPAHGHSPQIAASNEAAGANRPAGNILAEGTHFSAPTAADAALGGTSCSIAGGNQPHNNMEPFLAVNYIICLYGIFPARN
jgi:microcystin-dependent protein